MKILMRTTTTLVTALALTACGAWGTGEEAAAGADGGQSAVAGPGSSLSPAVSAQLDSGTVAYRAGRLEDARRHYRTAVARNPHAAAAWFGVYLAEKALENQPAADSAYEQLQALSPSTNALIPGHGEEGGSPHPEGAPMNPHVSPGPAAPANPHSTLEGPAPEADGGEAGATR